MTILSVVDILAAIDLFLDGQLDADGLEAWADRHELSDDVEYAEGECGDVSEALFLLSNPSINGSLTPEIVREVRDGLSRRGPTA